MTTIMGIEAYKDRNNPVVILASDLASTREELKPIGDIVYREKTKRDFTKIHVDEKDNFALAGAGIVDEDYSRFVYGMKSGEIPVRKILREGRFLQLRDLNERRFGGYEWDNGRINGFVIASNYKMGRKKDDDFPMLFTCFPLGRVERKFWTSIGSGSRYALEYLNEMNLLSPFEVGREEAIELADESLKRASKDMYTGGLDIVIVSREGIGEYGSIIKERLDKAREEVINEIKNTGGSKMRAGPDGSIPY